MKLITKTLIGSLIVGIINITAVQAQQGNESSSADSAEYKSPLFVDDVHCEGLTYDNKQKSYLSDAEKELEKKIVLRQSCIKILSFFGVKQHNWISQEDLDNASIMMKSSGYFENFDLWIKKSELKNHVHLFIRIIEKLNHAHQFNMGFSSIKQPVTNMDRKALLSQFSYAYSRKIEPSVEQKFSLNKNYIFDGVYNSEYKLTPEIRDIYWAQMQLKSSAFPVGNNLEVNLIQQGYKNKDGRTANSFDVEMEGAIFGTYLQGLKNRVHYGVSYHYFNSHKIADYFANENSRKFNAVLAPGLYFKSEIGSEDSYKMLISLEGNTILSKDISYRYNTRMEFIVSPEWLQFLGEKQNIGSSITRYKNYQSTFGRSLLDDRSELNIFFNSFKDIKRSGKTDQLVYGFDLYNLRGYDAIPNLPEGQEVKHFNYDQFKVSYKTTINNMDLSIGLGYGL